MTPDQIFIVLLTAIFVSAICYCFYLYHKAHGRDVDAVTRGAQIVMDALIADAKIIDTKKTDDIVRVVSLDDFDTEPLDEVPDTVPDVTMQAAKRFEIQQQTDTDKVMDEMVQTIKDPKEKS
ncbi:MAG: hypothetical protein GY820_39000 [Gammaproteobacteria bacterium]|nr:hypothetical protein [Gammaproteobacteria bacterium]